MKKFAPAFTASILARSGYPLIYPQAQEDMLEEAKAYIGKTDDIDETDHIGILTQLQHFGGKTNLIDFTDDYLIALFFACDGSHEKEGRVILLKRESDDYVIAPPPRRTIPRVESQKSVFVESPTGFVEPARCGYHSNGVSSCQC